MRLLSAIIGIFLGNFVGFSLILCSMYFINRAILINNSSLKEENRKKVEKKLMYIAKIVGNPISRGIIK